MFTELERKYRHDNGRKCDDFSECDNEECIVVTYEDAQALGIFDAGVLCITSPFDNLPDNQPIIFILDVNSKLYLVNTEGYQYCRYITPCTIS